jgi:hypothetical protein
VGLFAGCEGGAGSSVRQGRELPSNTAITGVFSTVGPENDLIFSPSEVESALPAMRDLPVPSTLKKERAYQYTGIIKNKTNYEVSIPAGNSGSILTIPPKGWIEYPVWGRRYDVTAYHDGKPFYCLKIYVQPKNYAFMCKKYDFMVEIVKPEPKAKRVPKKKKAIKKKTAPQDEGAKESG